MSDVGVNFLIGQVLHCQTLEKMRQTEHGGVPSTLAHPYFHSTVTQSFHLPGLSVSMAYIWEYLNKQKDI